MRFPSINVLFLAWALGPLTAHASTALGNDFLWHLSEPPVVERSKASGVPADSLQPTAPTALAEWTGASIAGVLGLARDDMDYLRQLREKRQEALVVKARLQTDLDPVLLAGAAAPDRPLRFLHRASAAMSRQTSVRGDAVYVRMPQAASSSRPAAQGLGLSAAPAFFTEDVLQAEEKTYALTGLSAPARGANAPMAALHVVESGPTWDLQVFNVQPTALLGVDPFGSLGGWYSRDGEMTVSHNASGGNPGGAMQGSFASQFFPIPQTDAFRLDNNINTTPAQAEGFLGDYRYIGLDPSRVTWVFDFMAEHVLPSDLVFRFSDGANTFFYPFNIATVGSWNRVYVPLNYTSGWVGGNAALFDNARKNVTSIEIQVTRSGTGFQSYYVDNLEVRDFSIPEPDTLAFLAFGAVTMFARRWFTRRRKPFADIEPDLS